VDECHLLPSFYMVDSIVLETQGKLRVVMLAMHDINKYFF
jgi:hypothetical protein